MRSRYSPAGSVVAKVALTELEESLVSTTALVAALTMSALMSRLMPIVAVLAVRLTAPPVVLKRNESTSPGVSMSPCWLVTVFPGPIHR